MFNDWITKLISKKKTQDYQIYYSYWKKLNNTMQQEIRACTIDWISRTTGNKEFTTRVLDHSLESTPDLELVYAIEKKNHKPIGVLFYLITKFQQKKIYFIPCLAVDEKWEMKAVGSQLTLIGSMYAFRFNLFRTMYLVVRTANPRVAQMVMSYTKPYWAPNRLSTLEEKQFCQDLATFLSRRSL